MSEEGRDKSAVLEIVEAVRAVTLQIERLAPEDRGFVLETVGRVFEREERLDRRAGDDGGPYTGELPAGFRRVGPGFEADDDDEHKEPEIVEQSA